MYIFIYIYIYLYIHTYISSNHWEVIEKSEKETRVINVVMDSSWPQKKACLINIDTDEQI